MGYVVNSGQVLVNSGALRFVYYRLIHRTFIFASRAKRLIARDSR